MPDKLNKQVVKSFISRRKTNALGLSLITAASVIITLICAMTNFAHTDVIALVTIAFVILCLVQSIKMRKAFRTIRKFKGWRKKSKQKS